MLVHEVFNSGASYQALAVSHKEMLGQGLAVDGLKEVLQRHSLTVHPALHWHPSSSRSCAQHVAIWGQHANMQLVQ